MGGRAWAPVIPGAYGGRTIDFRSFAADGMILVGRIEAARDGVIEIAPGLGEEGMADGDLVYAHLPRCAVDAYVKRRRMELPEDPDARATFADPPCVTGPLRRLDLAAEGVSAVVWATGYGVDFGWIDLAVTDARGDAVHRNGISAVPGLYFLGLAMAVEDELLVPVGRRRRRGGARRSYSRAAVI